MSHPKCPYCDEHLYPFHSYDGARGWDDDFFCENKSCPQKAKLKRHARPIQYSQEELNDQKVNTILQRWNYYTAQDLLHHVQVGILGGTRADEDVLDLKELMVRRESFLNSESL